MARLPDLVVDNLSGPLVGPVSFTVEPGVCAVIVGPSGAGKSLLLRMIADLDANEEGDVSLGGVSCRAMPAPEWRRRVIYVAAEPGWWAPCAAAHFPRDTIDGARSTAEALGLAAERFDQPLATLSTGEKQRLALVRALARRPQVLLLDEPTSGLDPANVERVEARVHRERAAGLGIVVVTHDAAQAQRLGTQSYAMADGRLRPA